MNLDYYRTKRQVIKQAIERKHEDWLSWATEGHDEAAGICARTIDKLYKQLEECDADIVRVKEELIKGAL